MTRTRAFLQRDNTRPEYKPLGQGVDSRFDGWVKFGDRLGVGLLLTGFGAVYLHRDYEILFSFY